MKHITYFPQGTCSKQIDIDVEDGIVKNAFVLGGCHGNLQGVCALIRDMPVEQVINKLQGIRCGYKNTSCPDQIAKALLQAKES